MKRTIALALLLAGCGALMPVPVPIEPTDTGKCPEACERLRALGCEEGQPLEDGTTCETFCQETQKAGHALNPTCVADISSCHEIQRCEVTRR